MTYTLWSHGELLGESELDYVRVIAELRMGDLQVTPKGLTVFERISQTHADGYYAMRKLNRDSAAGKVAEQDEKTLHADLAAEADQYAALSLELRAPNGTVIPTEDIYVKDTEYLMAISREADAERELSPEDGSDEELDPEFLAAVEELREAFEEENESWLSEKPERPPVRFQLHVRLLDEWAIP